MIHLLMSVQSVSVESNLASAGPVSAVIAMVGAAAVAGVVIGLLLKFLASAILNYPVRFSSAFLAVFISVLVSGAVEFAMMQGGLVATMAFDPEAPLLEQIMRIGLMPFVISEAVALFAFLWSIRTFLQGPNGERASWLTSAAIAAVMTLIQIAFAFAVLRLSAGLQ